MDPGTHLSGSRRPRPLGSASDGHPPPRPARRLVRSSPAAERRFTLTPSSCTVRYCFSARSWAGVTQVSPSPPRKREAALHKRHRASEQAA
eukprot:1196112-Prorocentrum_minimum.AAC.2